MIEMLQMLRSERGEELLGSPKREKEEEGEERGKESSEAVKTGLEFPKLLGVENPDAQLRCGDWLSLCGNKS